MKKEINPVVVAVVAVVLVLALGGLFYMKSQSDGGARPADAAGNSKTVGGKVIPLAPAGAPAGTGAQDKSAQGAQ